MKKSPVGKLRLVAVKRAALKRSQSAQEPSSESRRFGFIPADAKIEVVAWPKL